MTRVLSGAVLLLIAISAVWFAPPLLFLLVAEVLLVLACSEFGTLARAGGLAIPTVVSTTAAALTAATFAGFAFTSMHGVFLPLNLVLPAALVAVGVASLRRWDGGSGALASASAALMPSLYIGLPIGAMIMLRDTRGPQGLLLLMGTVFASDTAQYYSGRAFGRHLLAPTISPKKTIEGAVGGFIVGALVMAGAGRWLPSLGLGPRLGLGVAVVALGIAGDLFESMLKRSAGVKDSSALIPGHGGILDRIDALLFAAPGYHVLLLFLGYV